MESSINRHDSAVISPAKLASIEKHGGSQLNSQLQSVRPKQAAELLGIGVATLWRWVRDRPDMVRPIRLSPRCTVFPVDQLRAWRDAQGAKVGR